MIEQFREDAAVRVRSQRRVGVAMTAVCTVGVGLGGLIAQIICFVIALVFFARVLDTSAELKLLRDRGPR